MTQEETKEQAELGKELAHAMKAIEEAEATFAELRSDHKARIDALRNHAHNLAEDIRTGQRRIPLDAAPKEKATADAAGKD